MGQSTLNLEVTNDHAVPIEPYGGSVTILNAFGDTLYYADNAQVSASNNQGALTAGNAGTFTTQQWIRTAGLSTVQVTTTDSAQSSLQGPPGPTGPQGAQGAPGAAGPAGLTWRGAWASSTTYNIGDSAADGGASYFCLNNGVLSVTPPHSDATNWALLAAAGPTGPQGAQGPTGATGPTGSTGPAGPPGGGSANVVSLGNISGTVTCNLASGTCFTGTLTGSVTINFSNWPASPALTEPLLILTQDATGGRTITISGVVWEPDGTPPTFNTGAGQVNVIPLSSADQGTHLYGGGGASGTITGINAPGAALIQGQITSLTPVLNGRLTQVNATGVTAANAAAALTITTPDASGQVTEPAVEYIPGGWNGHQYWAVITGYTGANAATENPVLYYSDDGQTWTAVTTATVGGVAGTNIFPIVGQPNTTTHGAGAHNDDPDIVLGPDGKLHLFWTDYWQTQNVSHTYWCTYDGTILTTPQILLTATVTTESYIAPIFMWDGANDQWVMWYTDASNFYNSINAPYAFKRRTCPGTSPGGTWSAPTTTTYTGPASKTIWEAHIARRGAQLHIVATWCDVMTGGGNTALYFGVSNDGGLTWAFSTTAFLSKSASGWDSGTMYRGDIVPLDDGSSGLYAFWYSGATAGNVWKMGYTTITLASGAAASSWKLVNQYPANFAGAATIGSYVATLPGGAIALNTATSAEGAFYFDPADHPSTALMRIRALCMTNAVAPVATFTYYLAPVATWGGASGAYPSIATVGTIVASVAITTPAASAHVEAHTATFAQPAAGWYALLVSLSATTAASANTINLLRLEIQE